MGLFWTESLGKFWWRDNLFVNIFLSDYSYEIPDILIVYQVVLMRCGTFQGVRYSNEVFHHNRSKFLGVPKVSVLYSLSTATLCQCFGAALCQHNGNSTRLGNGCVHSFMKENEWKNHCIEAVLYHFHNRNVATMKWRNYRTDNMRSRGNNPLIWYIHYVKALTKRRCGNGVLGAKVSIPEVPWFQFQVKLQDAWSYLLLGSIQPES